MTGITGDVFSSEAPWRRVAEAARADGRLPVCVGFGISCGADASAVDTAAGVIVGSAVTKAVMEASDDADAGRRVCALVRELREALGC